MKMVNNKKKKDLEIWDNLFENIPLEWKNTESSTSMKNCLSLLKKMETKTLWDVGCGPGIWSIFLAKHGFKVYGSDFSPNAIKFAKDWSKEENLDIDFKVEEVIYSPFGNMKFDAIILSKIIENLKPKDSIKVAQIIHEKLNSNGIVYALFNPLENRMINKSNSLSGSTYNHYTDEQICNLFMNFSLVNISEVEYGFREVLISNSTMKL